MKIYSINAEFNGCTMQDVTTVEERITDWGLEDIA
jgi:hypothetical protein